MSQFQINELRTQLGDLRHRKNVRNFSEREVSSLREAFAAVYEITNRDDFRGYQFWAGKHGRPEALCDHGRFFLPWHRAYLYRLEKALQYHVPEVSLGYWNWEGPATLSSDAPPEAYTTPTLATGVPNPLFSGPIRFVRPDGSLLDRQTTRQNHASPTYSAMRAAVQAAMKEREFLPFQGELYGPHGWLHVRVGGDMGAFDFAAYDPIFWAHHANVDRQWVKWQRQNPDTFVPRQDYALPGLDMNVGRTVRHRESLGYDYVANEAMELFENRNDVAAGLAAFNASETQFSVADLRDGFETAMIEFHNVGHPTDGTREIRVFINQPEADDETPTEGNPHFAGSRVLLGKTMCFGEDGHCALPPPREKFDRRPRPPMTPDKIYMNVTQTMKDPTVVAAESERTSIQLVVVDQDRAPLPLNSIKMDGLSFIARD